VTRAQAPNARESRTLRTPRVAPDGSGSKAKREAPHSRIPALSVRSITWRMLIELSVPSHVLPARRSERIPLRHHRMDLQSQTTNQVVPP
jgi:hypothetical protein